MKYKYAISSVFSFNNLKILMKLRSKPISLKYFELFKFEKIAVRENKYERKLVFDHCAKINMREINRCPMREIKSARKLVRIRYATPKFNNRKSNLQRSAIS